MRKILFFSIFLSILLVPLNAFAEEKTYVLNIDEHEFVIHYEVEANVLAMAIDHELTSLLIGLENTKDSILTVNFQKEMISAKNNEFVVLVNGYEVDYVLSEESNEYTLSFYVPGGTEEIEIIGTHVIPEFPFGAFFGLILMTSIIIVIKKFHFFK